MSVWISLRGLRRLIWVDTLLRGHNVGFLAGWLIPLDSNQCIRFNVFVTLLAAGDYTCKDLYNNNFNNGNLLNPVLNIVEKADIHH